MFKKFIINIVLLFWLQSSFAQISPVHTMFQYSMSAFQPTAFPFNLLDKITGSERADNATPPVKMKGVYTNFTTRLSTVEMLQSRSGSTRTRLETSVFNADYISPNELTHLNKFLFCKIGGGILHSLWDEAQITSPFIHGTLLVPLGSPQTSNWRIGFGLGSRFNFYKWEPKVRYEHPDDKDIEKVREINADPSLTATASIALVHRKYLYLGVGYNRITRGRFVTPTINSFSEMNVLAQIAWGKRDENRNAQRDFFTHHHTNLVMYQLMQSLTQPTTYPLYWQVNHRFSLNNFLWVGGGYNAANRMQLQGGFLKIPSNKSSNKEFQLWISAEISSSLLGGKEAAFKQGGLEANIGYFF